MCEEVTQTSLTVREILFRFQKSIEENFVQSQETISLFLFVIHDWLAHLTDTDHKLIEYDSSLGLELFRYTSSESNVISQWRMKIRSQSISLNLLMYRHLLIRQLLESEIFQSTDTPLIYQLIDSLYYNNPRFATLDSNPIWVDIGCKSPVINTLRAKRLDLGGIVTELANRDDVTSCRVDVDHAILSSFTLLYILHLLEAMLEFELAIRPDEKVVTILSNLIHTLDHLRGVFFHVKD